VISLQSVQCPYCGEMFETEVDTSGENQEYVEDCYVCCRPILFRVQVGMEGELISLEVQRENE
jgi:NAD-dependent SIR2 family protein deacetylase